MAVAATSEADACVSCISPGFFFFFFGAANLRRFAYQVDHF